MPEGWTYGDIYFTDEGFPTFDRFVAEFNSDEMIFNPDVMPHGKVPDVTIVPTGRSYKDIRAADAAFGIDRKYRKENDLVWHHHQDTGRMQLINKDAHDAVKHTGGYAIWSKPLNV
ncbi:HNH endonuclease [Corynebacterium glucuronolyticum]